MRDGQTVKGHVCAVSAGDYIPAGVFKIQSLEVHIGYTGQGDHRVGHGGDMNVCRVHIRRWIEIHDFPVTVDVGLARLVDLVNQVEEVQPVIRRRLGRPCGRSDDLVFDVDILYLPNLIGKVVVDITVDIQIVKRLCRPEPGSVGFVYVVKGVVLGFGINVAADAQPGAALLVVRPAGISERCTINVDLGRTVIEVFGVAVHRDLLELVYHAV